MNFSAISWASLRALRLKAFYAATSKLLTAEKSQPIAEKSTDVIEGNGIGSRYKTDRRAHARHAQDLPKSLYRRGLVILHVEHRVELGNLQQVVHFLGQLQQLQFAALVLHRGICADQFADP